MKIRALVLIALFLGTLTLAHTDFAFPTWAEAKPKCVDCE